MVPNFSLNRQLFCKEADRHNGNLTSLIILVTETIKVICEDIVKKDFRSSRREKSCGGYSGEFAKFAGGHLWRGHLFKKVASWRPTTYNIVMGETPMQVFFVVYCKAFSGVFLTEHLRETTPLIFLAFINSGQKMLFVFISSYWCIASSLIISPNAIWIRNLSSFVFRS